MFRRIVAQVILDKLPHVKTVVNKLHEIDSVYRNFDLEILAGDQNTVVSCRESNAIFQFDFAKVYWNPRLSKFFSFIFRSTFHLLQVPNVNVLWKSFIQQILSLMSSPV